MGLTVWGKRCGWLKKNEVGDEAPELRELLADLGVTRPNGVIEARFRFGYLGKKMR